MATAGGGDGSGSEGGGGGEEDETTGSPDTKSTSCIILSPDPHRRVCVCVSPVCLFPLVAGCRRSQLGCVAHSQPPRAHKQKRVRGEEKRSKQQKNNNNRSELYRSLYLSCSFLSHSFSFLLFLSVFRFSSPKTAARVIRRPANGHSTRSAQWHDTTQRQTKQHA